MSPQWRGLARFPEGETAGLERYLPGLNRRPTESISELRAYRLNSRIDADTGRVEVFDKPLSIDCGVLINPLLVMGQVAGVVARGSGRAVLRAHRYDPDPASSSRLVSWITRMAARRVHAATRYRFKTRC